MPLRLDIRSGDFEQGFQNFLDTRRDSEQNVEAAVREILEDVRARGDDALIELTRKFDRFDLTADTIRITDAEIDAAVKTCVPEDVAALELAAERIRSYHLKQLPPDLAFEDDAGWRLGYRWRPIDAVGMYVPGGTAAYPSSVLMNAMPAKVAGVQRLVMVVPTPDGALNPLVMAAARLAGVDEVYRVGGAQAVAALAFGTETIAPVDKIVGPGNAYVATAKKMVFGTVGIDMVAGPSEILVVADAKNDPDWIAADLLAQAEHDVNAQSILFTDDAAFADAVLAAVDEALATLPRAAIAGQSWAEFGAVICLRDFDEAPALIDRVAPEHLELAVEDPAGLAEKIKHAGAIFLGRFAPEAIGDYIAGPNHVLPTGRSARFASGLGSFDFLKRTSMIYGNERALQEIGPAAVTLATAEGLDAHARSVSLRLQGKRST